MRSLKSKIAALLAVSALIVTSFTVTAEAAGQSGKAPLFAKSLRAAEALAKVGFNEIAARNGDIAVGAVRQLLSEKDTWVDPTGRLFITETTLPAKPEAAKPLYTTVDGTLVVSGPTGNIALTDAFNLSSRPGSNRTIFLDFDGLTGIVGTGWNGYSGAPTTSFDAVPYDSDGSPSTFSNTERSQIISIWQRVAEDYAAFDVNVTTIDPGIDAIDRTSASDLVFGTRAVITSMQDMIAANCGCGGVAYVGVFDQYGTGTSSHQYYQPAWIFTRGVGTGAKYIAEATSHEVGHNVGLSHDGTATLGYYQGQGLWAPIMGVGYYEPLAQWSKGEYAGANNTQDDYVVMQQNGIALLADDAGNTAAAATPLSSGTLDLDGIITTPADVDVYSFTTTGGSVTINANPATVSPNLDISMVLKDSTGAVVASSDPTSAQVSGDVASGLNASISQTLAAGTYSVWIDGVGSGVANQTGYSDYGSIGRYNLSGTIPGTTVANPPTVSAISPTSGPVGTVVTVTGTNFVGTSGVTLNGATASFTVVSDTQLSVTVPAGATSGAITVTNTAGSASSVDSFTVTIPAPSISGFTPTSGAVGTTVTINGSNLGGATAVSFNGTAAQSFTQVSASQLTAVVAAGTTSGTISVTTAGGTANSTGSFSVTLPTPTISSFSPTSGPVGTSVTINGTNFTGSVTVAFNGVNATSVTVNSTIKITAVVPSGATTGRITVTTSNGSVQSATNFSVTVVAPKISSFSPTSGPVGTVVTITGTGFSGATAVRFNNTAAVTYTVVSATQITATVPVGATTGKISVTTPGGTANSSQKFTVR